MKKVLGFFIAFMLLFVVGCKTQNSVEEITFGSTMKISYTLKVNERQIDSICNVDLLPNYRTWLSAKFTDYETNTVYLKRMYIKEYSDEEEIIYIIIGDNEPYKITRRIVE